MSLDTLDNLDYSTPRQPRVHHEQNALWTTSTTGSGSILRSSSLKQGTLTGKRVSIVSPIKWKHGNCSLQRKRNFIDSTINFIDIKHILRSLGCDASGGYTECVEKLLQSEWCPDRHHIQLNERLRAKPVQNTDNRVVNLQCGDLDYLSRFTLNELKRWLKFNHIQQPVGQSKYEYMKLIHKNYSFQSPSPATFRSRIPKRHNNGSSNKIIGRTPKHCKNEPNDYEEKAMESEEEEVNHRDHVRMQLMF